MNSAAAQDTRELLTSVTGCKNNGHEGDRTLDRQLIRLMLYHLSYATDLRPEGFEPPPFGSGIRRATVAPWPLDVREPRIELGTYCVLSSRHNQLDHSRYIPGGIRTPNLVIRSHTPYPLGHGDFETFAEMHSTTRESVVTEQRKQKGRWGNRTPDLSHPKRESYH